LQSILNGKTLLSEQSPKSGIYSIELESNDIKKAVLEQFPADTRFLPHGIFYSDKNNMLYVINHGMDKGGTSVLLFTVSISNKITTLTYVRNVKVPEAGNVGLNDVVEGAFLGEIYTTQWLGVEVPTGGVSSEEGKSAMLWNHFYSSFSPRSKLWRCTFDPKSSEPANCKALKSDFRSANGIMTNPERTQVYVNDNPDIGFYIFDREENGDLTMNKFVDLPFLPDNLDYNKERNSLSIGVLADPLNAIKFIEHGDKVPVSGGCAEYSFETGKVTQMFNHDGTKLSFCSACYRRKDKFLMGTPFRGGILSCSGLDN